MDRFAKRISTATAPHPGENQSTPIRIDQPRHAVLRVEGATGGFGQAAAWIRVASGGAFHRWGPSDGGWGKRPSSATGDSSASRWKLGDDHPACPGERLGPARLDLLAPPAASPPSPNPLEPEVPHPTGVQDEPADRVTSWPASSHQTATTCGMTLARLAFITRAQRVLVGARATRSRTPTRSPCNPLSLAPADVCSGCHTNSEGSQRSGRQPPGARSGGAYGTEA